MAGPSGRVKAICIAASLGHLLISSLSKKNRKPCLLLTSASEVSEHIEPVPFDVLPAFGSEDYRADVCAGLCLCPCGCNRVLINAEGGERRADLEGREASSLLPRRA